MRDPLHVLFEDVHSRGPFLDNRMGEVQVPTDLIWGDPDPLFDSAYARRMAAELPAARLHMMPDCYHVPQDVCPEAFVALLKKVLNEPPPVPKP